jgi:hypothetical protein
VAAHRRYVLHGVGRNLRHRRHRSRRRLRPSHPHLAADAARLEPAHGVDARRTCKRLARRRRLLRLGAARDGQLLGISGSLAVAGGEHLRHGHLSHAVCLLSGAPVPVVRLRPSRTSCGSGRRSGLRCVEHRGHSGCRDDIGLAVCPALRAVRDDRHPGAVQARSAGTCRDHADHCARRPDRGAHGGDVELHGLGQCFNHRGRGRSAAAPVSSRHAGSGSSGRGLLHSSGRRSGPDACSAVRCWRLVWCSVAW